MVNASDILNAGSIGRGHGQRGTTGMKSLFVTLIVGMLCTGCAVLAPKPSKSLLDEADAKMSAEDYKGASASYGEFVKADPGNAQAARARATQTALDRLLDSQTELDRVKRNEELSRLRREQAERQSEVDRVKRNEELPRLRRELAERQSEVDRLKAESAKLRVDLERLRNIDLQTLPGIKK
jgi:predicted RNase H-like nuclease (RuvC/YqgF family)